MYSRFQVGILCINNSLHGVFATKKDSLHDYLLHAFNGDREYILNEEINQTGWDRTTYFLRENNLKVSCSKFPK